MWGDITVMQEEKSTQGLRMRNYQSSFSLGKKSLLDVSYYKRIVKVGEV